MVDLITVEQSDPALPGSDHHHDTGGRLSFNGSLQRGGRHNLPRRATPGVNGNVRRLGRVALVRVAADRVRRQEKFHALDVSGRCANAHVHVAATDPLGARRHSNLVRATVVADRCASGVSPWKKSSQGCGEIVTAGLPTPSWMESCQLKS